MPRNIEIKAKVANISNLLKVAQDLSNGNGEILQQKDIFYLCSSGRLKLRSVNTNGHAKSELIFYQRPDQDGPKLSNFVVAPVSNAEEMDKLLSFSNGSDGIVAKERTLFMVGQTRVHVDKVEGLGNFMELEVQLSENQTVEEGSKIANDLMEKLGVKKDDLITGAYHDLLKLKESSAKNC